MVNNEIKLMYPLDMYYPDGIEILSLKEQEEINTALREYQKTSGRKIDINDPHPSVQATILMLEQLKQYSYFKNVREILNMILSGNRTIEELFRSLFPNSEEEVEDFKCQFGDACDLILLKDQIDWKRMSCEWYNFAKEEGKV